MAIARDAASALQSSVSAALTLTWSHTCTGNNLVLLVGVNDVHANTGGSITGVTYNGIPMTQLKVITQGNGGYGAAYIYGLINPPTGSNSIVATRTGGTGVFKGASVSYKGVTQSSIPDATAGANDPASSNTLTTAITTVAANAIAVAFGSMDNGTYNASTGATLLTATGQDAGMLESSTFPIVSPGSYSMTQTGGFSSWPTMAVVSLAPVPPPVFTRNILSNQAVNRASTY